MTLEEMLSDERKAGREEGRIEGRTSLTNIIFRTLQAKFPIDEEIKSMILAVKDLEQLENLCGQAICCTDKEDFLKRISQ